MLNDEMLLLKLKMTQDPDPELLSPSNWILLSTATHPGTEPLTNNIIPMSSSGSQRSSLPDSLITTRLRGGSRDRVGQTKIRAAASEQSLWPLHTWSMSKDFKKRLVKFASPTFKLSDLT